MLSYCWAQSMVGVDVVMRLPLCAELLLGTTRCETTVSDLEEQLGLGKMDKWN